MVAKAVTEDLTEARENNSPYLELVEFTPQAAGDWYDSRKFGFIDAVFAANGTTDSQEYKLAVSTNASGSKRVTITPETVTDKGYLVIFGRK